MKSECSERDLGRHKSRGQRAHRLVLLCDRSNLTHLCLSLPFLSSEGLREWGEQGRKVFALLNNTTHHKYLEVKCYRHLRQWFMPSFYWGSGSQPWRKQLLLLALAFRAASGPALLPAYPEFCFSKKATFFLTPLSLLHFLHILECMSIPTKFY